MSRTLPLAVGVAVGCATLAVGVLPAASSGPNPGGWAPYRTDGFTRAAGELCPFALESRVAFDREFVRTTSTYANGDPKRQEYVGPLVVKVTNADTGRSVQRDLSARAVVTYDPDGAYAFDISGPVAVGFYDGDDLPQGFYVLRGRHTVRFEADGSRRLVADHGREENLCETLS